MLDVVLMRKKVYAQQKATKEKCETGGGTMGRRGN